VSPFDFYFCSFNWSSPSVDCRRSLLYRNWRFRRSVSFAPDLMDQQDVPQAPVPAQHPPTYFYSHCRSHVHRLPPISEQWVDPRSKYVSCPFCKKVFMTKTRRDAHKRCCLKSEKVRRRSLRAKRRGRDEEKVCAWLQWPVWTPPTPPRKATPKACVEMARDFREVGFTSVPPTS
jgi:hypothetical protein